MRLIKKYTELREQIQHGDIVLFRGRGIISGSIQWLDKSYYSHAGLVFMTGNRRFVLDSTGPGVHPDFLSLRMKEGHTDFCIIRPKVWHPLAINKAMDDVMNTAELGLQYDFALIFQIALFRLMGASQKHQSKRRCICSEFVRQYTAYLNPKPVCFTQPHVPTNFITPWDLLIYADTNQFEILFDNSSKTKYRKPIN